MDLDLNFFLSAMSGQIQSEVERQLDKALVSCSADDMCPQGKSIPAG